MPIKKTKKFFSHIGANVSRRFYTLPIRNKILLLIILMILIPMLLAGFYYYTNLSRMLTENAFDNLDKLILQINENIEGTYQIINNTSLHFISNSTIRSRILDGIPTEDDYYSMFINKSKMEEELKYSLLFNNAWDMKLITTAFTFLNETTYFSISRSDKTIQTVTENNVKIFKEIDPDIKKGFLIMPPSQDDATVYFTRIISNINSPEHRLILIIGTSEDEFFKKYKKLLEFPDSIAYIIDDNGVIFSTQDKSMLGKKVDKSILDLKNKNSITETELNKQIYYVASKEINDSNLTFVAGIPKHQILAELYGSIRSYLIITSLIVLICLTVSVFITLGFTQFIKTMMSGINMVRNGNYDIKMPEYKDVELNMLSETFNNMTTGIKYLIDQVYEKQLLSKEMELKFLQSQINPHFLFNTLVTISYKAKLSQDETIYKMVTSLSELLQASIYSNTHAKIPIREELELAKIYLYLQKIRFEDKLEYNINVKGKNVLDYYLPRLSLEPIVENAVVHGIERKMGKGTVTVNITESSKVVLLEVIDDGLGFEPGTIRLKNSNPSFVRKEGHHNIGLSNTDKRIKLIYGEQYGLTIKSEPGKGTKVVIRIPVDLGDSGDV
ncbi:MAG: sensor histidine kinase [Acetivibrionales bacterium]|jgi:two-component system sensor histidine kinase YesM